MRKVAVVGGSGFIGRNVVQSVLDAGHLPVIVGKDGGDFGETEFRMAEATDVDAMTDALRGCDTVVHLAARSGGIQMQDDPGIFALNRKITDVVLESCRRRDVGEVFLASSQVVYRDSAEPLKEDAPILSAVDHPSEYAWSKATDEVVGQWWSDATGARVVVGRFGNVYGPGARYSEENSTVVHALIRRFAGADPVDSVPVWGDGSAVRSFVYVEDAGRAVVDVLLKGTSGGIYNIDSGIAVPIADLASAINDVVGNDLTLQFDASKPTGTPYRVGSIDRLTDLGFAPHMPLGDGLRSTFVDFTQRYGH